MSRKFEIFQKDWRYKHVTSSSHYHQWKDWLKGMFKQAKIYSGNEAMTSLIFNLQYLIEGICTRHRHTYHAIEFQYLKLNSLINKRNHQNNLKSLLSHSQYQFIHSHALPVIYKTSVLYPAQPTTALNQETNK